MEDLVLYRGAWFVLPLNARQETGALIRFVGAVSRPNDGGERLVVRYLPSRSQGERFLLADNVSRMCPVSALARCMGFADASHDEAGGVLSNGREWHCRLGDALASPQRQVVMHRGRGPRQVWGGDTSAAYYIDDMLVRTMRPAEELTVVTRMVENLVLAFATGGDGEEGGSANGFTQQ